MEGAAAERESDRAELERKHEDQVEQLRCRVDAEHEALWRGFEEQQTAAAEKHALQLEEAKAAAAELVHSAEAVAAAELAEAAKAVTLD